MGDDTMLGLIGARNLAVYTESLIAAVNLCIRTCIDLDEAGLHCCVVLSEARMVAGSLRLLRGILSLLLALALCLSLV